MDTFPKPPVSIANERSDVTRTESRTGLRTKQPAKLLKCAGEISHG